MKIRIVYLNTLLVLFLLFSVSNFAQGQDSKVSFINEVIEMYKHHSSVSYEIDYSIKTFDGDEPYKMKRKCQLIRIQEDSIFGGIIFYSGLDTQDNYEKYYDLNSLWFIDPNRKEIKKYDAHQGQTYPITGNFDGEVIKTYFLKPDNLKKQINDKNNIVKLNDTSINSHSFLSIKIKFPDDDELSGRVKNILINLKTKNIEKIYYSVNLKDQFQINAWEISNIKFDGFDTNDLRKKLSFLKLTYSVTDYVEPTDEEYAPLENNTISPDFSGKKYPALEDLSSKEFAGKIIILDFWYMACHPCTQAIPCLNKLYQKYKDDIVVLGLNPYDSDTKRINKIPAFIERNNMLYPIVFINDSVIKAFKVKAFPTLYVIDKSGVIRNAHIGYSEKTEIELDEVISNLIKQ